MNLFSFVMITLLLFSVKLNAFNFFYDYSKVPPDQNVQDLTVEQINNPTDPYINYNLGVALYQTEKFDQAKSNFQRCLIHAKNSALKERCYFNLANSFYKNGLSGLPVNWQEQNVDVEQNKLTQAIQEVRESIKNYESVLELNKNNINAKTNLEKAKDTLKKLQEKMKQQQQNQQNNDKKDQNQDKNEKQQQNQNSEKNDSNKDSQQDKQPESSGDRKESNDKQKNQQQPTQNNKDSSGKPDNNSTDGNQNKPEQENKQNEKQQDFKHEQDQSKQGQNQQNQNSQQYGNQADQQKQEPSQQAPMTAAQQDQDKQDSAKQKSIKAMLDNLQNYESNLQKIRVQQKTQDEQNSLKSNQKPW